MNAKKKWKAIGNFLLNCLEIYIPVCLFLVLFVCFLLGIVFRYFLKNPQSWTFELSSICYLAVGILSWGICQRNEEHIVFDMLYNKVSPKSQCLIRTINNLVITVVALLLIVPSINYLQSLQGLKAQTLPIPRFLIFVPFTISFTSAAIRSGYRFIVDLRGYIKQDYKVQYAVKEENE